MSGIDSFADTDLLATAGDVGQSIYEDGTAATALDLDTDETCYATLIVTNSKGDGGADEDDDGSPLLVLVIKGTSTDYMDETEHLSSSEIQSALEESGDEDIHAGVTAWAHVAQILITEDGAGGAAFTTVTMNRNNAVSEA